MLERKKDVNQSNVVFKATNVGIKAAVAVPEPDAEAEADAHQVDAQQADVVDAQQAEAPELQDADAEVQEDAKYLKRLFKFHFNF